MQVNKTRVLKATNGAFDGVTDFLVYGDTVVTVSERTRSLYVVEEFSNTFYYVGRGEYDLSAPRMEDVDLQALRVTGDDVTTTITQSNEAILTLSWDYKTTARPTWDSVNTPATDTGQRQSFDPSGEYYMSLDQDANLRWVNAYTGQVIDTAPALPLGFVDVPIHLSGFLIADVLGRKFAFGYSEEDGAIISYFIGPNGIIRPRDILDSEDAFFAGRPHDLEIAHFEDRSILIIADSQTGALTTVKVNEWGGMFYMHSLYDSRDTRFEDVVAIDYTTVGSRHFIVAGGGGRWHYRARVDPRWDAACPPDPRRYA